MEYIEICGGKKLSGSVALHGAKNSALPILAACVLAGEKCVLENCPNLTDVTASLKILEYLGCRTHREDDVVEVDSSSISPRDIPDELMHEMRSSIVFLGPMLARFKKVCVAMPGGCEIGLRPIDLHLSALKKMGADISSEGGRLICTAQSGLHSARITLDFPSVGATENIMLAAVTASGKSTVVNAAREPEIKDLADFLNSMGADVRGAGESVIEIYGVERLGGAHHRIIPDRIAAATYMACAAVTGSNITLERVNCADLDPIIPVFEKMGCDIGCGDDCLHFAAPKLLISPGEIRTMPYPGFPTDAQAVVMAACCVCYGTTVFTENIFESRYKHVGELIRMGAKIKTENRVAVVSGVSNLYGADVVSRDLRGGACLITAGLKAKGITRVTGLHHIDRGYENIEENLASLGAQIKRVRNE